MGRVPLAAVLRSRPSPPTASVVLEASRPSLVRLMLASGGWWFC